MPIKPTVLATRTVPASRMFRVEERDLRFSNGEERTFERLAPGRRDSVIVAALDTRGSEPEVVLIREYAAGFHEYQLALPKGRVDAGESALEAANRELKEEAGCGARNLEQLKSISVAPGQMGYAVTAVLATDLFDERLPGDEPEPLEVVRWPLSDLRGLYARDDFTEGRSMAALHLLAMRFGS